MIELDTIHDEAYEAVQEIGNDKGTSGERDNVNANDTYFFKIMFILINSKNDFRCNCHK